MRILLVSDAWYPQVNGVVRTLDALREELRRLGHAVDLLTPEGFRSIPCPSYPEIRLALPSPGRVARRIASFGPQAVHIATEGPLGFLAAGYCRRRRLPFTTSFHTLFPEYVHARWRIPVGWTYGLLRRFHGAGLCTMVATASIEAHLAAHRFVRLKRWSRGVDLSLFHPRPKNFFPYPRPISLYVGRLAVEKSVSEFLALDLPGTKVVVGDGPQRVELAARHPDVAFLGVKTGADLAAHYAAADVFVFPSRTDTFGLVLLEALASGVPVAAYPVAGPRDVLADSAAGVLDEDLGRAAVRALAIDPALCRAHAERFSWRASAEQFLGNLAVLP